MATKNISRTVIEGGRAKRNQQDRYLSNRKLRAEVRDDLHHASQLSDIEDYDVPAKRQKVRKEFEDKLGAVRRWMESRVGKPWDETFSELTKKFDTRNMASRHVVVDHILGDITFSLDDIHNYGNFWVDDRGLLQKDLTSWRYKARHRRTWTGSDLSLWANNRKVSLINGRLFWMAPRKLRWIDCPRFGKILHGWSSSDHYCGRDSRFVTKLFAVPSSTVFGYEKEHLHKELKDDVWVYFRERKVKQCRVADGPYFMEKAFSNKEIDFWNQLMKWEREQLLLD